MARALLVLVATVLAACGREEPGHASASAYTSVAESIAREDGLAGTASGATLEAPRLIPAIRTQMDLMASGAQPVNPENLIAYKNMTGDLISSMTADLYRAGFADTGRFQALSDSILEDLGGGATTPPELDRSELAEHLNQMQRLINVYQRTMRRASPAPSLVQ